LTRGVAVGSGWLTGNTARGPAIFSWDRKDGESLSDYVRRLESMLLSGPSGVRVDIHDAQIKRALTEAKALLQSQATKEPPPHPGPALDHLSAAKRACASLTAEERAELILWLSAGNPGG
jgi:hypothetical protein